MLPRASRRHVEHCLRCQAELVQYRKILRTLRSMRTEVIEPAPGMVTDVLAHIEEVGERTAIRSILSNHKVAYISGIAAATAAGAAGSDHRRRAVAARPGRTRVVGPLARRRDPIGHAPRRPVPYGAGRVRSARLARFPTKGSGSTGRAPVSKTGGWGFESLLPCSRRFSPHSSGERPTAEVHQWQ